MHSFICLSIVTLIVTFVRSYLLPEWLVPGHVYFATLGLEAVKGYAG